MVNGHRFCKQKSPVKHRFLALLVVTVTSLSTGLSQPASSAEEALLLRNFDAAAEQLVIRAEAGETDALYHLAGLYRRGLGVPKDPDKAAEIYRRLAAEGDARAAAALAGREQEHWWIDDSKAPLDAALHWAAQRGLTAIVDDLLAAGVDVNLQRTFGRTALFEAAQNDQGATVRRLLEAGAKPNIEDDAGDTALILAVRHGASSAIDALLQGGADINQRGYAGNSALIISVQKGDT